MPDLIGIRFRPSDKVQYFNANGLDLSVGDRVLADTDDGPRKGVVVIAADQVLYSDLRGPLSLVLSKVE